LDTFKLISEAASIAGSYYKLAKLLNVSQSAVGEWRDGKRPCPPEEVASIAAIAGYDPHEWLARATLAKHEGTRKGERLRKVLGKSLAAITVGSASFTASAHSLTIFFNTMYIM
jgi:DNA-binding transcriptional regulator YdaS (Cro superfamily)